MNRYLTMIFAGVTIFIFLFIGINFSQIIINNTNITGEDEMSENFNSTKTVAVETFGVLSYIPYLLFIIAFFSVLLILAKFI